MAELVYTLCAVASLACASLLIRAFRRSRMRLLLWSGLCFIGLAVNSILVCVDLIMLPSVDLRLWRTCVAMMGMGLLLFGLVWETGSTRSARP